MGDDNSSCQLREKLVEDLPGVHWYVTACRKCHREYGSEFAVPHRGAGEENEPASIITLSFAATAGCRF